MYIYVDNFNTGKWLSIYESIRYKCVSMQESKYVTN